MSWSPADDYDDQGNYQPGPTRTYPRHARCQPGCCTGTPLCHDPEGDHDVVDRWHLPLHRTEAGYPDCSTCDGGGCPDCTDPA